MVAISSFAGMLFAGSGHPIPDVAGTLYSASAVSLNSGSLRSPDGTKTLLVSTVVDSRNADGTYLSFTVRTGNKKLSAQLPGFSAEVLWSPDSEAFGVTQTEGGGGIGIRAYLFFVDQSNLRRVDLFRTVEKEFRIPGRCEVPVPPNSALVTWVHGSDRVLVVAEVVPVSICECQGTYVLYEVGVAGLRIYNVYGQADAMRRFRPLLGRELRGAPDKCSGVPGAMRKSASKPGR
jgi:hypothetical protein